MLKRCSLAAVLLLGLIGPARAAFTSNSIIYPQTPINRGILQFTSSSSAGTYGTLYTAGSNGSICNGMWTTNTDTSATHVLTVQVVNSSTKYGGVSVTTTEDAGFAGNAAQSLMSAVPPSLTPVWVGLPVDSYGNSYLVLASGDTIQATFATAITSSDVVNLEVSCADY